MVHCDLKPENILYVDSMRKDIKIIDLGSGCFSTDKGFTYVQSRFYRAPEVVLGLPYEQQIDMWSLGCIVSELYSGVPLFPGVDENELLEFHILLAGNPPQEMIDKAKKKDKFFQINNGYKIKRSPNSRLVLMQRNQISLN